MDQTQFNQNQEIMQPPPKPKEEPQTEAEVVAQPPKKKIKPLYLALAGLGVFILLLVLVGLGMSQSENSGQMADIPGETPGTTIPERPERPATEFGQRLNQIEQQIIESDPSQVDLDPPPLNYNIRL